MFTARVETSQSVDRQVKMPSSHKLDENTIEAYCIGGKARAEEEGVSGREHGGRAIKGFSRQPGPCVQGTINKFCA